jgi:hypothetical protein
MTPTRAYSIFLGLLSFGAPVCAEEPRKVIDRAIKAMGLDLDPARVPAMHLTFEVRAGLSDYMTDGHLYLQSARQGRLEAVVRNFGDDRPRRETWVLDGGKAWSAVDGQVVERHNTGFPFLPFALPPLLADRNVRWTVVEDREADRTCRPVLRATDAAGHTYVVAFDRDSGLVRGATVDAPSVALMVSDYRELKQDEGVRATLQRGGILDGMTFLRRRAADPGTIARVRSLVHSLGDVEFAEREKASAALVKMGPVAAAVLRHALHDPDPEIARRARECLDMLELDLDDLLMGAAIRQIVADRPEGAVKAFLAMLPAASEATAREAMAALTVLVQAGRNPDPVLLRGLNDPDPIIRAAAAGVLGRDGGAYFKQPGRRLYLTGVKLPARFTIPLAHGMLEGEFKGVEFFNAFDPSLFARP